MTGNLNIVEYKNEYKNSCIDLLDKIFPSESNRDAFKWRFENKDANRPIIVCAIDDDKVVAFNAWIPWKFTYKNEILIGYQSGKSATDVNYRRQGIFEKILKKADDLFKIYDVDFLFGFPGSMSYGVVSKTGYCPIGVYNSYLRLINPLNKRLLELNKINHYEEINFNTILDKNKISSIFDRDYFQWRYIDNPKQYDFVFYEENNNKALFIVRETKNMKFNLTIKELLLLDCHFSSFNQLFVENAMNYLSRVYASKVNYIITFFNPDSDRGRALKKFFHIRRANRYETLMLKPIKCRLNDTIFFNYNNWDVFPHVKDAS